MKIDLNKKETELNSYRQSGKKGLNFNGKFSPEMYNKDLMFSVYNKLIGYKNGKG